MLQLSPDRPHRHPLDGASPAPRRPTPRSRRSASMSPVAGAGSPVERACPPGGDAPARTAGSRGRRGAGARDDDRRGQLGALAARATRAIIRAVGTSPTRITTSA